MLSIVSIFILSVLVLPCGASSSTLGSDFGSGSGFEFVYSDSDSVPDSLPVATVLTSSVESSSVESSSVESSSVESSSVASASASASSPLASTSSPLASSPLASSSSFASTSSFASVSVPAFASAFARPTEVISRIGNFPLDEYTPLGETYELKNRQIENQQLSEECYLFAFTNYLQVANRNIRGHELAPRISGPYLATVKLMEHVRQSLELGESRLPLVGGNIPDAIELTVKYGLVPDEAWSPRVPFKYWPFPKIYQELERSLRSHQRNLSEVSSSFGSQSTEYEDAFQTALTESLDLILKWSGPLPERFKWQGQIWTPARFAGKYGVKQIQKFDLYSPVGIPLYDDESVLRRQLHLALDSFGADFSIWQRDWAQIEMRMKDAIDRGIPVLVGVHWSRSGHVMTAVGYELRGGRVYAWKFLNSWGRYTPNGETYYRASDVRNKADQVWILD